VFHFSPFPKCCERKVLKEAELIGSVRKRAKDSLLIPEEAAPQFLDDAAPRNGMMSPPDSEMIAPPITE
jgi:hypothetical protein